MVPLPSKEVLPMSGEGFATFGTLMVMVMKIRFQCR